MVDSSKTNAATLSESATCGTNWTTWIFYWQHQLPASGWWMVVSGARWMMDGGWWWMVDDGNSTNLEDKWMVDRGPADDDGISNKEYPTNWASCVLDLVPGQEVRSTPWQYGSPGC